MMKPVTATLFIVVAVAACWLSAAVRADDLGSASPSHDLSAKINQDINQAAGIVVDKPSADVESQIKDLEATRAAVDQGKGSAISLSVSGWIAEQTQFNIKQ
jgi:hypothetical protein